MIYAHNAINNKDLIMTGSAPDVRQMQLTHEMALVEALGKGLLRHMNPETGLSEVAERCYTEFHPLGRWVTKQQASLYMGDNIISLKAA